MQEQRIERFARFMAHLVPDAITAGVILTVVTERRGAGAGESVTQGGGRVSPGPVDAAAVHDADDADHRVEHGARRPLRSSAPCDRGAGADSHDAQSVSSCWRFSPAAALRLLVLGTGLRFGSDDRDLFRGGGGAAGDRHRFSVPAGGDHGGAGALAVRAVVERAAAGGDRGHISCRTRSGLFRCPRPSGRRPR